MYNMDMYTISYIPTFIPKKPDNKFEWTDAMEELFNKSKDIMLECMKEGVRLFDVNRPTMLSTDWSIEGIGFMLRQKYCNCPLSPTCCMDGWKLALIGSRFTTPTERRYAPIEGEALAVAYALNQTRFFTLGCSNLIVTTDHKPLVNILNDKSLADIGNRRLLNLKEKTLSFRFTIHHVSAAKNKGPDATSRYPVSYTEEEDMADDNAVVAGVIESLYATTNVVTWEMIKESTANDDTLKQVTHAVKNGFPQIQDIPQNVCPFHRYASQLYIIDGVLMLGEKVVVPTCLRGQILEALHGAHQGITMMNQRASDSVYWPGISSDINRTRN